MNYQFNLFEPPLLREFNRDILAVSAEALTQLVGSTNWESKTTLESGVVMSGITMIQISSFVATRKRTWRLSSIPVHYATDVSNEVTRKTGYSETQKHSVEKTLGVTIGAKGFGLSAEVKAALKITDETTAAWNVETSTVNQREFKAATTYCTWCLVDGLYIQRTVGLYLWDVNPTNLVGTPAVTNDFVECTSSVYEDKVLDLDQKAYVALTSSIMSRGLEVNLHGVSIAIHPD